MSLISSTRSNQIQQLTTSSSFHVCVNMCAYTQTKHSLNYHNQEKVNKHRKTPTDMDEHVSRMLEETKLTKPWE